MCINLSCTKAENAHLFLNQMINYKSLQTYTKEWCTGLLAPPPPDVCSSKMNLHSLRGTFRASYLLDWSAYKRGVGGQGERRTQLWTKGWGLMFTPGWSGCLFTELSTSSLPFKSSLLSKCHQHASLLNLSVPNPNTYVLLFGGEGLF